MFKIQGNCHCKNLSIELTLTNPPESYQPRACDCEFCLKHRASYFSDPQGRLQIQAKNLHLLGKYQQEKDDIADFLHCLNCGVLIGVVHTTEQGIYGAINSAVIDPEIRFGVPMEVSPKKLSDEDKIKRWKDVWFRGVSVTQSS